MSDHERGMVGAWLGLLLGAVYGLVSTIINIIVLPNLPIYVDSGQVIFNVITSGLAMMAAGYITARPHSSLRGVLTGAIAMAAFQIAMAMFNNQGGGLTQSFGVSYILFIFFLPLAALLVSFTGILRLGVNWHYAGMAEKGSDRLRLLGQAWLGAIVIAMLVGSFAQYTVEEKETLVKVNNIIQRGLTTVDPESPLASVDDFQNRAVNEYTLSAFTGNMADETGASQEQFTSITARFANGLTVQCLSGRSLGQIICAER